MRLRPIAEADLETVRLLRNENRQWFFDNRVVTPAAQRRWFVALAQKPIEFYVIEVDGRVVGTVSVSSSADGEEIGNLLLDPAFRRRGVMRSVVAQLIAAPGQYFARVKLGNAASERVFLASGFEASVERSESVFRKTVV